MTTSAPLRSPSRSVARPKASPVTGRMARCLAPVVLALALSACSESLENISTVPTATLLRITEAGAGPITAATPYSKAGLESLLPGYTIETVTMASENRTETALAAFSNGLQVLQILSAGGGRIAAVHGVTHHMTGPNGERIGMTFVEARQDASACRVGTGNWNGMPICTARGAPSVSLVYAVPGYESSTRLPDQATLAEATLQRIIWTPRSGG